MKQRREWTMQNEVQSLGWEVTAPRPHSEEVAHCQISESTVPAGWSEEC